MTSATPTHELAVADPDGETVDATRDGTKGRLTAPAQAAWMAALILVAWWAYRYWPTPLHLATTLPAPPGDSWGGTAVLQAMTDAHANPFVPGRLAAFNAPDGWPVPWQINVQQWPTTLLYTSIARLTGDADVAQNLYMASGIVGTGASMAWLTTRFIVHDRWIGVIVGVALALNPMLEIKAAGHTGFAHLWPIVLMIGAVLAASERPSWRRNVAAGAMAFIAMSWTGYHLLLAGTTFATLLIGGNLLALRSAGRRPRLVASLQMAGSAATGLALVAAALRIIGRGADPTAAVRQNTLDALYVYGARWYEFIVPTSNSSLFGDLTRGYLTARRHGSNGAETPLYLGWSMLLLAVVGVVWLLRRRTTTDPAFPNDRRVIWIVGPLLATVAIIWSLPPTISPLGLTIPTPSNAIFEVITSWRVYSRFVLVAAIGVAVLAAIGLRRLAGGSGARRTIVLVAAMVVIPADLVVSIRGAQSTAPPKAVEALAALPPGIVASYPLERGEFDGYRAAYNQQYHDHPTLNLYDDQPEESRAAELKDLRRTETVRNLAALGVRYVLVVHRKGQPGDPTIPATPNPLLKQIATTSAGRWPAEIYAVPRTPNATFLSEGEGFGPVEPGPVGPLRWATVSAPKLSLEGECAPSCRGTIRVWINGFGRQRLQASAGGKPLMLRAAGRPLASSVDVNKPLFIEIPVEYSGEATVELTTTPGAVPVKQLVASSADPRSLSIAVSRLEWKPAR